MHSDRFRPGCMFMRAAFTPPPRSTTSTFVLSGVRTSSAWSKLRTVNPAIWFSRRSMLLWTQVYQSEPSLGGRSGDLGRPPVGRNDHDGRVGGVRHAVGRRPEQAVGEVPVPAGADHDEVDAAAFGGREQTGGGG